LLLLLRRFRNLHIILLFELTNKINALVVRFENVNYRAWKSRLTVPLQ
jgi:hypothetical protein